MNRINPYKLFVGSFIPNWLSCRPEISQGAKHAYARLCQYAGDKGVAYPRLEQLAREIGVKDRQVRTYIKELVKYQLIEVKRLGLGRSNRYYFCRHPWMSDRQYTATQERRYTAAHLKRIIEENHQDENKRIDRIISDRHKLKSTEQGLYAGVALGFGRDLNTSSGA